jgi:hypothetical protein
MRRREMAPKMISADMSIHAKTCRLIDSSEMFIAVFSY